MFCDYHDECERAGEAFELAKVRGEALLEADLLRQAREQAELDAIVMGIRPRTSPAEAAA